MTTASLPRVARPRLGEAVDLPDGSRGVVSILYAADCLGVCLLADVYGGGFFYGPNVGPPRPGVRESVSVSGGPHPAFALDRFEPTDQTVDVSCWHWRSLPCAGGGVYYRRTVPLWRVRP